MGWKTDQVVPPPGAVDKVMEIVLKSIAQTGCKGLRIHELRVHVSVWVGNEQQSERHVLVAGETDSNIRSDAHTRLRFRRTFKADRFLFFAQLRMDTPDERTGLSGVIERGEVKVGGDTCVAQSMSRTFVYNGDSWLAP